MTRKKGEPRPSWDEYFMKVVDAVSERATCDRGYGGCILVRDKQILSTGYVGSPKGSPHCDDVGHEIHEVNNLDGTTSKHCIRTTHCEQNAIALAAKNGISIDKSTLYIKYEPCYICAKILVNAGIKRVVCQKKYHRAQRSREVFLEAGVELDVLENEVETYDDMS